MLKTLLLGGLIMGEKLTLSLEKQIILASCYLAGVRAIIIQNDSNVLIMDKNFFGPYSKRGMGATVPICSEEFDFSNLRCFPDAISESLELSELLKEHCPKYSYVLDISHESE